MSSLDTAAEQGKVVENKRIRLSDIQPNLDYLARLSPVDPLPSLLTKWLLATTGLLTDPEVTGFDAIKGGQDLAGPEGLPGVWDIEILFNIDRGEIEKDRVLDSSVKKILDESLKIAWEGFRYGKYLPSDKTKFKPGKYPSRKEDNPIVRLVLPESKFVDVPFDAIIPNKVFHSMLDDHPLSSASNRSISDLELILLTGQTEKITGYAATVRGKGAIVHEMSEWEEISRDLPEPPFIILRIVKDKPPSRIQDPYAFASIGLSVNSKGKLDGFTICPSHMTNGEPILRDFLSKLIPKVFENKKSPELTFKGLEKWPEADQVWKDVGLSLVPYNSNSARKVEKGVFGSDSLMEKFCSNIGVLHLDARLSFGKMIGDFLRLSSKIYGGSTAESNLASLYLEGQSPMFAIGGEGPAGLQIGLGLGGPELTGKLKEVLDSIKNISSMEDLTSQNLETIHRFWLYWEGGRWRETFLGEVDRGKQGRATITKIAETVGIKSQNAVSVLAGVVVSVWANFIKARDMISSLGPIPQEIKSYSPFIKNIFFNTAGGADNNFFVGLIGDTVTGQSYGRDPLLWMETIAMLMKKENITDMAQDLFLSIEKSVKEKKYQKFGISEATMFQIGLWLNQIVEKGQTVETAFFGQIQVKKNQRLELSIIPYMMSVGIDTKTRTEILDSARALVFVVNEALEIAEQKGEVKNWHKGLRNQVKFVAKYKLGMFLVNMLSLSVLSGIEIQGPAEITDKDRNAALSFVRKFEKAMAEENAKI